jgi:hypothetical protein
LAFQLGVDSLFGAEVTMMGIIMTRKMVVSTSLPFYFDKKKAVSASLPTYFDKKKGLSSHPGYHGHPAARGSDEGSRISALQGQ